MGYYVHRVHDQPVRGPGASPLAGNWPVAAALIVLERFGKGIQIPARDAMLSYATKQVGHGWGFGIHEALDQIGAIIGPLTVAAVLFVRNDPRTGFAILLVPALMAISVLVVARFLYPRPQDLEPVSMVLETKGFPPYFGTYLAGVALVAAGFVDFALVSFDFQQVHTVPLDYIPVLYAVAMGVDAIAALVFGRLFDRAGVAVFTVAVLISSLFAPLVFLGNSVAVAILGVAVWGIGMGAQESSMRAAVASMVSGDRRGTAYGVFNTGPGIFWFAGSDAMGVLYDISLSALVVFPIVAQLLVFPLLLLTGRIIKRSPRLASA